MLNLPQSETIPFAPLKIIAMDNCKELGKKINSLIVNARHELVSTNKHTLAFLGYEADSYLIDYDCRRYSTGEAALTIKESIRGKDLFILSDITNHSLTLPINGGGERPMSADDHFQDLKRVIAACSGSAKRIHIIMPFLYEGRQNIREKLESLDCAVALQELEAMDISSFITFDAHEPRVQNAIPIDGFDNFHTSYQFIKEIMETQENIQIDKDHLTIVSPDVGGMSRAVYYANILELDMGMFFNRHDYSIIEGGQHPLVSIEFLGNDITGKDVILVDDMIASGASILSAARELKKRNARRVIIAATYGLLTHGIEVFDDAYEEGLFDTIYTTNLCYCPDDLKTRSYYHSVDLSRYLALIIDRVNNDISVNEISDASMRIKNLLSNRK